MAKLRTEVSTEQAPDITAPSGLESAEQAFLTAAKSLLIQRQEFARTMGLGFSQFAGQRDLFRVLGYPESLSFADYKSRFERGGIAKRIVSAAPEAMGWSKLVIIEDEDPDVETEFELACKSLFSRRLNLGSVLKRADIQAGIGEYSVIYIGVKEKGTKGNPNILAKEMSRLNGPDDIAYLRPLPQDQATIIEWVGDASDDDVSDERYGLPKYYNIQLSGRRHSITGMSEPALGSMRKVHWSRVIHVTHEPLDNEVFAAPKLQAVWNYLCDLDKLVGGGSEATYKEAVNRTLFDLDKDIGPDGGSISAGGTIDPVAAEAFKEQKGKIKDDLEEMMHGLRQYVLTRGISPKTIPGKSINFEPNVRVELGLIASTMTIPQRKLFGSEAGHLASQQDEDSWNDYKATRQNEFGVVLVRDLFDRLIKYNALPTPKKEYTPKWPMEDELSEKDKAGVVNTLTLANRNQMAADGTVVLTNNEIREMAYPDKDPLPDPVKVEPVAAPITPGNVPAIDPAVADGVPNATN